MRCRRSDCSTCPARCEALSLARKDVAGAAFFWLAGSGAKRGTTYGVSDEVDATVADDAVHVHDFHLTSLHLRGIDTRAAHTGTPAGIFA